MAQMKGCLKRIKIKPDPQGQHSALDQHTEFRRNFIAH